MKLQKLIHHTTFTLAWAFWVLLCLGKFIPALICAVVATILSQFLK